MFLFVVVMVVRCPNVFLFVVVMVVRCPNVFLFVVVVVVRYPNVFLFVVVVVQANFFLRFMTLELKPQNKNICYVW